MRVLTAIFWAILLLAWPPKAHAQTTSPPPVAGLLPWYAGVQLANHAFEIVVPGSASGLTGVHPYQLTVGRYLTPRWAVQVGYSAYHFLLESTAEGTNEKGQPMSRHLYAEDWVKAVPVLMRRHLTRNVAHRMQFQGLAGATLVRYRDKVEVVNRENGAVVWQSSSNRSAMNAYLTLGPAASYRLGRHLEACFDFLLTKNLHAIDRTFSTQQLNSILGFQHGWNLGLRYQFDVKKRAE